MNLRFPPPPPRPLLLIYADGATSVEVAHLRSMLPRLVTARNRGEPVGEQLKHVETQLALLDAKGRRAAPACRRAVAGAVNAPT